MNLIDLVNLQTRDKDRGNGSSGPLVSFHLVEPPGVLGLTPCALPTDR